MQERFFRVSVAWTGVIGARALFSYGASHWFTPQLGSWPAATSIPAATITDGLIFMAVAMVLTRAIGLGVRALAVPGDTTATIPGPEYMHA